MTRGGAAVVGIAAGLFMGGFRLLGRTLEIYVNALAATPRVSFIPLIIVLLGIGFEAKVAVIFLGAVMPVVLNTYAGVLQADGELVEMARSFGATRRQLYAKVLLLSALPEILAGVRLGAIRGVKGVVIGQLLVAIIGVGELFEIYSNNFLMEEFWALVLIVFAFAFAVSEAIAYLDGRALAGIDHFHRAALLPADAHAGQHELLIRCYLPFAQSFGGLSLQLRDTTIFQLGQVMRATLGALQTFRDSDPERHALLARLNAAYNTLDLREGWQSERFAASCIRATFQWQ